MSGITLGDIFMSYGNTFHEVCNIDRYLTNKKYIQKYKLLNI